MARRIWDGRGDAEGSVYFVDGRGIVRGRPHVRALTRRYLRRAFVLTPAEVDDVLAKTVDRDDWLAGFDGMLPGAVARSVLDAFMRGAV